MMFLSFQWVVVPLIANSISGSGIQFSMANTQSAEAAAIRDSQLKSIGQGLHIRVAYVRPSRSNVFSDPVPPKTFNNTEGNADDEILQLFGNTVDYHIFTYVQDTLNLTADFYPAPLWAHYDEVNKTWEGMAKLLIEDQADYAANGAYLSRKRVRDFRFLAMGYKQKLSAYIQIPPTSIEGFRDVATSALRHAMIPLFGLMLTFVLALKFGFGVNLSSAFILTTGGLAQQGANLNTVHDGKYYTVSRDSIRILFCTMCLCFFLVYAHMTAVLISKFSIRYKSISNLNDLLDEGYQFGVLDDSYLLETTQHVHSSSENLTLLRVMHNPALVSKPHGMRRLFADPKFALLTEVDMLTVFQKVTSSLKISSSFCDILREITLEEVPIHSIGFVQRGSNLSSPINFALTKMWESGTAKRFWTLQEQMHTDTTPKCPTVLDETINPAQLTTPYAVLCLGFIFSSVFCILEKYLFRNPRFIS